MSVDRKQKPQTKRRPKGTGSIYERPNSPYLWIQYPRNGRLFRESAQTTDRSKAQKLLQSRLAEITTGTFLGPEAERVRVEELAPDFFRDYRINKRSSIRTVTERWEYHLKPFFGVTRVKDVTSDVINRYVDARLGEDAAASTINREIAALRRMFRLGYYATPPKVLRLPKFPQLREDNVRTGFLEDGQYQKLVEGTELWFRALVECARTYGWRNGELVLKLRVGQVDLLRRVIRLEPGTTKNRAGREVTMTSAVHALLSACVVGKKSNDSVFSFANGEPVKNFRSTWQMRCTVAGLGQLYCRGCAEPQATTAYCRKCGFKGTTYRGLLFHDLRRTAARGLRSSGVAEEVIMKFGGWKTPSVFKRYAIVDPNDVAEAMQKFEKREAELQNKAHIKHIGPNLDISESEGTIQ